MIKEAEIDVLAMPWVNARVAHLLLVHRMMAVKVGDDIVQESSSDDYDQVMFHPKCGDYRGLFLLHDTGESSERPTPKNVLKSWCKPYGCEDQLFASGPHHTKYIHRAEARK